MDKPVVETAYGKVLGELVNGIYSFKGIRYGAPPVGNNRFMPPQKPAPWAGVKEALKFGYSAPQSRPAYRKLFQTPAESEDCLFLNIWTAGLNSDGRRPVMFWLHGGGFSTLSASTPIFNGANLARRGAVVVSINHRLGALGYTHFGDIGGIEYAHSGNVGMLDVIAALEWVRDNIAQFGGDSDSVMVFGQSGGGQKISMLLGCPLAKGLFHRAVIESGPGPKMIERDYGTMMAEHLLKELGLDKQYLDDIHNLSVDKIIAAQHTVSAKLAVIHGIVRGFAPVLDEKILPAHPFYPEASYVSADVPIIIGYNRTEATKLSADNPKVFDLDEEGMRKGIKNFIGDEADKVIKIYRKNNPGASPSALYFSIMTDYPTGGYSVNIAERKAKLGKASAYLYRFDWETPVDGGKWKSPHGLEVAFVFDNIKIASDINGGGPLAEALAARLSEAWIAFARTGNPNTPESGLPAWLPYDATHRATMLFNNESEVVNDPMPEERRVIDKILNPA